MKKKLTPISRQEVRVGIRWRLFVSLAFFTLLILLTIWVVQIRLLSFFYQKEKFEELQEISDGLESCLALQELDDYVGDYAKENNVCIRIFSVEGDVAIQVANADITPDCMLHHFEREVISDLYDRAQENGGIYNKRFEFSGEKESEGGRFPGLPHRGNSINAIHARIFRTVDAEYLVLLDMELTPVDATVKTLEVQFVWIAGFLLGATFLMAGVLSHIVAKPLTVVTEKARNLAAGDFTVDFSTGIGYREVQDLADVLHYAAGEISAAERLQHELISNISHDLRTPLTMIKGYSEMMRDIPGENSPENIQAVIDETTRLSELVNDLLDLSKLQAGTQKLQLTVFDITQIVKETMQRYDTLVRHKGYHIDLDLQGSAFVCADRVMILQVVYNLINNAINYTGEGLQVHVRQTIADGKVRLSIADDGEGIAPDQIKEIWDRYYRVDKEHKRAVVGTGLGLSIVKGILESHKASYGVDSAVGVGSVFWFELPLVEPEEQVE